MRATVTLATLIDSCGPPPPSSDPAFVASGPERELLIAGFLARGAFEIVTRRPDGLSIRANERHYYQPNHADYADRYVLAFQGLCRRGLVRHGYGPAFVLTRTGWRHARKATAEFVHTDWLLIRGQPEAVSLESTQPTPPLDP